eukprot:scaffold17050_cov79-Cylindrotheca_fusiformis.AAC.3
MLKHRSAFELYCNELRKEFNKSNPEISFDSFDVEIKRTIYRELSIEKKLAWVAYAEAEKARQVVKAAQIDNSIGDASTISSSSAATSSSTTTSINGKPTGKKKRKRNVRKKDPNAPKRHLNSFVLYKNSVRGQIKKQHGRPLTAPEVSKIASQLYQSLSPENRNILKAKAEEDKVRYQREMAAYKPPPGYDSKGFKIQDQPATTTSTK